MTTIAVVTSVTFGGNLSASFSAGLNASGVGAVTIANNWQADGNYGVLQQYVRDAANTTPDLIVAAGGLPTAMAADATLIRGNDPQFVYLSGALLNTANQHKSGGVNQNVTAENQERKGKLTGHAAPFNVDPARIWLVVNNNNPFSDIETNAWGNANYSQFFQGMANPPNNSNDTTSNNHFIAQFHALASGSTPPLGLVISPDPYFRHWRTAFTIALANQLPVPVCYPYHDFVEAAGNPGNATSLNRPILARPSGDAQIAQTAYYQLGSTAGRYLIAKANGDPHKDVGVTAWNAASHTWQAPPAKPMR